VTTGLVWFLSLAKRYFGIDKWGKQIKIIGGMLFKNNIDKNLSRFPFS